MSNDIALSLGPLLFFFVTCVFKIQTNNTYRIAHMKSSGQ